MDFARWIVHFPSLNFGFATWRWFRNLEMICNLEMIRNFIRSLEATSWPRANFVAISQPISQLWNKRMELRNGTRVPRGGFAVAKHPMNFRNSIRLALCSCLQTTITSLFQLQFVHHLKSWTPNFPSFETTYSMHKMNSRKYSKCVQELLSSRILHVRFLSFSSLHSWLALAKNYEAPKLEFFM